MSKPTVLVAEDESALVTLLRYNLEREGYRVLEARDGEEALLIAAEEQPDMVILDWMMPQLSGIEVCRRLRSRQETRNVPILMLTARGEETDRIRGLDTGADDYLTKPFSPRELVARIRTILRRHAGTPLAAPMAAGAVTLDAARRRVEASGRPVELTSTEFDLLAKLMSSPGQVFTREQLLSSVWGHADYGLGRTVDVHIAQLRAKLGADSPIRTSRGVGYSVAE
jgi:two-component system phosphate regulon response regulator PhoB